MTIYDNVMYWASQINLRDGFTKSSQIDTICDVSKIWAHVAQSKPNINDENKHHRLMPHGLNKHHNFLCNHELSWYALLM
jgi:hypothetical protein